MSNGDAAKEALEPFSDPFHAFAAAFLARPQIKLAHVSSSLHAHIAAIMPKNVMARNAVTSIPPMILNNGISTSSPITHITPAGIKRANNVSQILNAMLMFPPS